MKKKVLFSFITSLALTACACVFLGKDSFNVKASDLCDWNHYLRTEPTYSSYGNKEYWICCTHHDYSLIKPTSGKGIDKEGVIVTPSQLVEIETRKDEANSPYLPSYKSSVDEVISLISALPQANNLKAYSLNDIQNARSKYDALAEAAKSYVTNYSTLQSLESSYNQNFGLILDLSSNPLTTNDCAESWVGNFSQESFSDGTYGKGTSISVQSSLDAYEFAYSNASSISSYKYVAMYVYAPVELHFFISRNNWRNNVMNVNAVPDLTGSVISDVSLTNKQEANNVQLFGLSVGWHEIIFDASRFSSSGFIEIWGNSSKTATGTFSNWKISNIYGIKENHDVTKVNTLIANLPKTTSSVTSLTASAIEGIDKLYNSLSSSGKSSVIGYDSFESIRTYVNSNYVNLSNSYDNGYQTNVFVQEIENKSYVDSIGGTTSKLSIYHTQSPYEHCGVKPNNIGISDLSNFTHVAVNIYNPLSIDLTASFVNGDYGYLETNVLKANSWTELKATPSQFSEGIKKAYILIYSGSPITNDGWLISSIYGFGTNPGKIVKDLISKLPLPNDLVIEDFDQIINAKRCYDNLNDLYKPFVTNYSTLTNLIAVYNDDFAYISNNSSFITKGSFDYAHTKDYQASILSNQSDLYYGTYTQINFESFDEFKTYTSSDTWGYTPCVKINPTPISKSYSNLMFYVYNPTNSIQSIYLYKGYWVPADAKYKNESDSDVTTSTNVIDLKSGWTRIVIDDVNAVNYDNFVLGFVGKGQGTCEGGWKITNLRGQISHDFSENY